MERLRTFNVFESERFQRVQLSTTSGLPEKELGGQRASFDQFELNEKLK